MDLPVPRPLAGTESGAPTRAASFLGRGFSWPLAVDHTGSLALTSGAADLDSSISVILSTAPSERLMRPEFGCEIWHLLFEPVTSELLGRMKSAVVRAVDRWEPRVHVDDVVVTPDDDDSALVHIAVSYTVRSTNDRRNLVYPFYVIPREES